MADLLELGVVQQETYNSFADQSFARPRLNRRREVVVPDWRFQLVQDGRVFQVSNATRQTALAAGGTAFGDTTPAFVVDFPTGTTGVPLEIVLNQGGTVAGATINVLITVDSAIRFSTGGAVLTVRNCRDAGPAAAASAYSNPTALALDTAISLYSCLLAPDVSPAADSFFPTGVHYKAWENPYFCVGPASLVIYTFATTTQPSWFFRIVWAEIPTVSVT